jgi:asparagine synthase (glutamine-hydrolysing)
MESPEDVLAALSAELCGGGGRSVQSWTCGHVGIAINSQTESMALVTLGAYRIALLGRPRWIAGSHTETNINLVCQRFLDQYRSHGSSALAGLQGPFAIVVIDSEAREVLLAIDRFGISSLVYQADEQGIMFGSTCDVLRRHPRADHRVDPQGIYNYLYFNVVPGPTTIFRSQKRLLPGQFVTWSKGRTSVQRYWSMTFAEEQGSVSEFKPGFRQALRDAVQRDADGARSGAFLSGGTDSSTVAGLLASVQSAPAKTYSIGFAVPEYDEMEYARIASRHFGTEHHEYYVTPDDVVDVLPAIASAYDQPFGNASAVATYYCARLAKTDGVTRLLAGDGGDELFGGNTRYAKQYQLSLYDKVPAVVRRALIEPFLRSGAGSAAFPLVRKARSYVDQASRPMPGRYEGYNLIERLGPHNVFTPEFLSCVNRGAPLELIGETYEQFSHASPINQLLGIDLKFTLADNDLQKVTRMCELAGIDVAFPMLDEGVVALSGRLPANLKLRGRRLRYFFKEALRDFLPGEILVKQKHGFGMPVGAWLTQHQGLNAFARDCLSRLETREIIAPAFIDRLLREHLHVHPAYYGTMAWILMMLELWFQKHLPSSK